MLRMKSGAFLERRDCIFVRDAFFCDTLHIIGDNRKVTTYNPRIDKQKAKD